MRAKLPDKEGFVSRDGVKLAYEIYGNGPQTMVFIPPWSIVHSRIYKAQLPYFSERFRCITYDGRGNGKSDRPEDVGAYTLDNYIADALAVMDATNAGQAILVGLSFGGLLACMLAAHHPQRVKAAILAGTVSTIGPAHFDRLGAAHFHAKRDRHEGWDKFNRDYWLTELPRFRGILHPQHLLGAAFDQTDRGRHRLGQSTPPARHWSRRWKRAPFLPSFDVSEQMYRNIRCPVLFIHGDNDQIQPHERAQAAAPRWPARSLSPSKAAATIRSAAIPARANADQRFSRSQARHRGAGERQARPPRKSGKRASISPRRSASATAVATSPSRANCASSTRTCRSTGWRRTLSRGFWKPTTNGSIP